MSRLFQQNEAIASYRLFPIYLVDNISGIQPITGETGIPQISKTGGSWANISHPISGVGNGYYYANLEAVDLDSLGLLSVRYKSVNTMEFNMDGQVVAYNPFISTVDVGAWNGTDVATNINGIPIVDMVYISGEGVTSVSSVDVNVTQWASGDVVQDAIPAVVAGNIGGLPLSHDGVAISGGWIDQPISVTGTTPVDVWSYENRVLTSGTNITSDGGTIDQTKMAYLDQALTTTQGNVVASGQAWLTATGFSTHSSTDVWADGVKASGAWIDQPSSNQVDVNKWSGVTVSTNVGGVPIVDTVYISGVATSVTDTVDANIIKWLDNAVVSGAIPSVIAGGVGGLTLSHDGVAISGGWIDQPISVTGTTPVDIWSYTNRVLTSGTNITSDGGTIDQNKLAYLDQAISTTESNIRGGQQTITALSGIIIGVEDHGDSSWNTATGFSTHSQTDVRDSILSDSIAFKGAYINQSILALSGVVESVKTDVWEDGVKASGAWIDTPISAAGGGTTPIEVWNYANRVLTSGTNITSDGGTIDQTKIGYLNQSILATQDNIIASGQAWITATGFSTHTATDIWADGVKASGAWIDIPLSSAGGVATVNTSDIWSDGIKPSGANLDVKVSTIGGGSLTEAGIADAVWDETLSDHNNTGSVGGVLGATSGVIQSVKTGVWLDGVKASGTWIDQPISSVSATISPSDVWSDGIKPSGAKLDVNISSRSTLGITDILSDSTAFAGANINTPIYDVIVSGDARWTTAEGFSTHSATDVWADSIKGSGSWIDAPISSAVGGTTPAAIWTYANRILTSGTNITSDGGTIDQAKLAYLDQSILATQGNIVASGQAWLTATGFSTLTVTDILSDSMPFSGSDIDVSISSRSSHAPTAIWSDGFRPSGYLIDQRISEAGSPSATATAVWSESTRELTSAANITSDDATIDQTKIANMDTSVYGIAVSGDSKWITATGFSTHTATDVWADGVKASGAWIDQKVSNTGSVSEISSAVWSESTRELTGAVNITSDGVAISGVNGVIISDIRRIYGSEDAAHSLKYSAASMARGTVTSSTTTTLISDVNVPVDDHWNGRIIIFTSGTLKDQATAITDSATSNDELTFTAITSAPLAGVTFVIV